MASTPDVIPNGKYSSRWYARKGIVYFVSAGEHCDACKSIKIGVSTREGLLNRLKHIQSANHSRIRLVALIPVDTMLEAEQKERELHVRFREFARIPGDSVGHEWFTASAELLEFIQKSTVPLEQGMSGLPRAAADAISSLFVPVREVIEYDA